MVYSHILSPHKWVKNNNGCVLINFNYKKTRYSFSPVSMGKFNNPQDVAIASQVASEIELDIKLRRFEGLDKYKPRIPLTQTIPPLTLTDIWQQYKLAKADKVAPSTQYTHWRTVDNAIDILGKLELDEIIPHRLVNRLIKNYAASTVGRICRDIHAALTLAVKRKLIPDNPLTGYQDELPAHVNKRKKSSFSSDDAVAIIQTFRNSDYSYYSDFVEFLFLTGLRPQAVIALTWEDIKSRNDGSQVMVIDKGHNRGVLGLGKNKRTILYPVYPQLKEFLTRLNPDRNHHGLMFPSPKGKYLSINNFTTRIWKPVIQKLVETGELREYLPTYHCRHTAASMLANAGVPDSVIATLLDTSNEMLNRHYFDNEQLTTSLSVNILY